MCQNCGCHKLSKPQPFKAVAPGQWHIHADGTAHRHDHPHPGEEPRAPANDSASSSAEKSKD